MAKPFPTTFPRTSTTDPMKTMTIPKTVVPSAPPPPPNSPGGRK